MVRDMGSQGERFFSFLPISIWKVVTRVISSPAFTLICLCVLVVPLCIALIFSITYIAAFLYGLLWGHPLPSREIFLFFPSLAAAFADPAFLAKALLAYGFAGFAVSSVVQREDQSEMLRRFLAAFGKQWNTLSFLIIFSLLFATLGEAHFFYKSIGGALAGLLPYSDANGHYAHYTRYFYDGVMGDWVLRRPLAAFMGATLHWLAGNDPAMALLLRCLLVCCGIWASCAVVHTSFGIWSAIICLALEYAYISIPGYLMQFLTESLGFFWGCMAAALWLYALREKRLFWELAAFSVTLVGLLVRMGSMFLVPALFLYVLWRWRELSPGRGWWKKPLLGLCLCAIAIALLNATFASRGMGDRQQTGSNFAYCFVGMTLGTNWTGAQKTYMKQLRTLKDEKQQSNFLYKQGLKNILHSPSIFLKRLVKGEVEFIKNSNFFLFHKWWLVFLLGSMLFIRRKALFPKSATAFWIAIWGGILLSIPFIYFDDSYRINIFVYPLIASFFSLAVAIRSDVGPLPEEKSATAAPWLAITLSGLLLLLMTSVALFPRLHTSAAIERIQNYKASVQKQPANRFLVDAKGMGFLVVPDGEEPDAAVPSMTWSTFRDRYQKFAPSVDDSLFTRDLPNPPFVVYNQIPVNGAPSGWGCFIAPPEVLKQKNVLLWDLEVAGELKRDDSRFIPWKIVAKATPALFK